MVVNATKDGIQFSVGEAKKSLALTGPVYKLLGKPDNLRHAIFEGPHDYSKAMREAMYGFMTLHLKGEGNGDPIPEPEVQDREPRRPALLPRRHAAEGLHDDPEVRGAGGEEVDEKRPDTSNDPGEIAMRKRTGLHWLEMSSACLG